MSWPLRMEYEDTFYHVKNRDRQQIYPGTAYYQDYLRCLDEAHRRFGIEVHTHCLMGNHYHLLVKTPQGNQGYPEIYHCVGTSKGNIYATNQVT